MHGFCDIEPQVYHAFNEAHKYLSKEIMKKTLNVDYGGIYSNSIDAMHFGLNVDFVKFLTNQK